MTGGRQVRVVVIDTQPVMRDGLRINIEAEPDLIVVAEACDREGAIRETERHRPDVLLLDLALVEKHGERLVRRLLDSSEESRMIVLSSLEEERLIGAALRAGASFHVRKDAFREELIAAIREAVSGPPLDPRGGSQGRAGSALLPRDRSLDVRQTEILQLIARGLSDEEIGAALGLSESAIKEAVEEILAKMGTTRRVQAAIRALKRGSLHL